MPSYQLYPKARFDLQQIGQYTCDQWGVKKMESYIKHMHSMFEMIVENPKIGRNRDDLQLGCRSFLFQSHVIFYEIANSSDYEVFIIRILHQKQDVEKYFDVD